ncbi:MAG: hypothetical protein BGO29_15380 [Bacteroidales bacterium 36-12]|mgnify:CR=1 FL=1|jgi:predicted nucleotidyltransferase|nr:MAG: hypothetical protein BGO29_15380 [Bacteroidales bacterium 36-12]
MRLTKDEINAIVLLAKKHFSDTVKVYLFGSRVDDNLRGGDIDLLIHAEEAYYTLNNEIRYSIDLQRSIGERKIDIVFDDSKLKQRESFYKSIHNTKKLLTEQL